MTCILGLSQIKKLKKHSGEFIVVPVFPNGRTEIMAVLPNPVFYILEAGF